MRLDKENPIIDRTPFKEWMEEYQNLDVNNLPWEDANIMMNKALEAFFSY